MAWKLGSDIEIKMHNDTRVAIETQVRVDGHAERLKLQRDRQGTTTCDVDSGDGESDRS